LKRAAVRIKVGGLKILEGDVALASSRPGDASRLGSGVCAPLALNQINLTLLAHMAGDGDLGEITLFATASSEGAASFSLLAAHNPVGCSLRRQPNVTVLSLYPHNQHPGVAANLLLSLRGDKIVLHGLASSPAALVAIFAAEAGDRVIQALFEHFVFSSYPSPPEFQAAQSIPAAYLREVVASYQEKIIKIYYLQQQSGLDLWRWRLPHSALEDLSAGLLALGDAGLKVPLLLAVPEPGQALLFSFSTPREQRDKVRLILGTHLPGLEPRLCPEVAEIVIHGPHFGERYGIAAAFVQALEKVHIPLMALSCAVSSISAIVRDQDLAQAAQVLEDTFAVPAPRKLAPRRE
jgi:aspartokinase